MNTTLSFDNQDTARLLYGHRDDNLRLVERILEVHIGARGCDLTIKGEDDAVALAAIVLEQLYGLGGRGIALSAVDVSRAVEIVARDRGVNLVDIFTDTVFVSTRGRNISPKGINQKLYVDAIRRHDVVFGIGPAGTGKTFLAMAMALTALLDKRVKRIILTRPAVEAGERLGFLPGDLQEKVNPYLRPLYDAIYEMIDADRADQMMEHQNIEVAPLAFMRGRTLNDAFIILDEAQNATTEQMRMFLTRIGFGSQAVITGDITQVDLPRHQQSGLIEATRILADIPGIEFMRFTDVDVVRHPLVKRIIRAYEQNVDGSNG